MVLKSCYYETGKLYKKLDAYVINKNPTLLEKAGETRYFGSSVQFSTCKKFKAFLSTKYPGYNFKTNKAI